ncbi:uncharacterized protein LOC126272400 isoform X2 [Schistocerca gregaria]|uniref:uncharacterized protein LOC126272400 isoform X2 n=1 Tax=Schistocerca gregaria TaxID=7010 RepID=UPI00211E09C4|nr:uncharacterized protein LOC126272400 isoform X2 [Schistocerca gregaria]
MPAPRPARGPGHGPGLRRARLRPRLLAALLAAAALFSAAAAEKNKYYHMQQLCKNHFLQQLYRKIDGAVLQSQNERNLDCVITFQTHSILQRFMLRFDLLQLDCNDHLFIYDGAHAVGSYKSDLTCRNTESTVGAIYTRTNFVTLKYVTDGWGTDSNGFRLVVTAFKDKKHACEDFRCTREFCIDTDLVCDDVNHCGDASDEAGSTVCPQSGPRSVLGLSPTMLVVAVVSALLLLSAAAAALAVCLCRRSRGRRGPLPSTPQPPPTTNTSFPLQQMYGWNGGGASARAAKVPPGLGQPQPQPPPPQAQLQPPPGPGNWRRPAGLQLGYSVARVRLYCLAE